MSVFAIMAGCCLLEGISEAVTRICNRPRRIVTNGRKWEARK